MKKTIAIFIGLILNGQLIYSQSPTGYCVKTKSLTRADLKMTHPFDKTAKIQLVSFKPDIKNESPPMRDGVIDTTKFLETKTLSHKEEDELINILYNYSFDPKINKDSIWVAIVMCYEPRNAIIFRNKYGEIITYLEICFECLGNKSLRNDLPIIFCQDKYTLLRNYFGRLGIKFGITEHE